MKSTDKRKAHFYKEPLLCVKGKFCSSIRKAYLVPNDFVQTAQVDGPFVCAIFRNFNGWGGKVRFGWLLLKDLNPIRNKLRISDLTGSWWQAPCDNNDDCGIFISADKTNNFEIDISGHLHERPSDIFNVQSIKELPGKLILLGTESGDDTTTELELSYDNNRSKPGTILIKGSDIFQGEYYK